MMVVLGLLIKLKLIATYKIEIMKTLKLTVAAIFSIGLLTAVLPSTNAATEIVIETPNHEVDKPIIKSTVFGDKKKGVQQPTQG